MRGERMPPVRKSLGQHFLSDRRILGRIVDAIELRPGETVIEIGAGRGALTDILREHASRTIAVEYDRLLAQQLRARYDGDAAVQIVEADVLEVDFAALAPEGFALVGNVPYYITTPILFKALEPPRPRRAVFLVQLEVAVRMAAPAGDKEYGALSVNLQVLARAEIVFRVPPGAFRPPPRVESAVVRVTPLELPLVQAGEEEGFRRFVQEVFSMRRKQMQRVLRAIRALDAVDAERILDGCGVAAAARPETLTPADFVAVFRAVSASRGS